MRKNKIMVVAVAAMMVAVAAAGVFLYLNSDDKGQRHAPGILLSASEYSYEWISIDAGVDAWEALHTALEIPLAGGEILGAVEDPNDWTLWTMGAKETEWKKITTDPKKVMVSEYGYISWTKGGHEPIRCIDASGKDMISMIGEKNRIVSLSASITEKINALGLVDKIVASDNYSDYPQIVADKLESGEIAGLGSYWGTLNFEGIVNATPDLVIADIDATGQRELIKKLRDAGITVLASTSHKGTVDEVCESILMMGLVTKRTDEAKEAVTEIKDVIDELRILMDALTLDNRSVLFVMPPYGDDYYVAAQQTTMTSLLVSLGLTNVITENVGWFECNNEKIIEKDPYLVIVMGTYDTYDFKALAGEGQLGALDAVKKGRVCAFDNQADSALSRPGPRITHAMELIYILMSMDWDVTENQWFSFDSDYEKYLTVCEK